jgi:SAM-dependent methyltransferase
MPPCSLADLLLNCAVRRRTRRIFSGSVRTKSAATTRHTVCRVMHGIPSRMTEIWDQAFVRSQTMWGLEPTASALLAADVFAAGGAKDVLIPGIGYGRNAKPFLQRGMQVTGIEISATAIALARSELALDIPIHHGSVLDMPFDARRYDAIFSFGLLYLLDAAGRQKLLRDCAAQLAPGGPLVFTVISKQFEMYGKGTQLGEDWYETHPGMRLFFYDERSIQREFSGFEGIAITRVDEPMHDGSTRPFLHVTCFKG